MRIVLQDAGAARIDIDLSVDREVRRISLSGLRGVVGQLERANSSARLRPLRAAAVVLDALEWPLPGGHVSVASPGTLNDLAIELDVEAHGDSTPLSGSASAARADADAVAVDFARARFAFDAELRRARVQHSPDRIGHAAAEEMEVANFQAVLGGLLCRLSSAALERVRVDWQRGELLIGGAAARASGISVAVPGSGLTIEVDRVELPGGLLTSGGSLVIPELVVPELRVAADDVVELFRRPARDPEPRRGALELGFLDRVTGRLDVDMKLDISLPVLGRRESTHHFRVPIAGGIINYRELERDLANLEDAFIDVEVRGHSLVIERAIPLIPGLEKPLVIWDLDHEELELARRRLVRLRTIPRLRLVGRGERNEKSNLALRSLRFENIEIAIGLDPPPPGQPDAIGRASAGELRATGRIVYDRNGSPETTRVELTGSALAAGPLELGRAGGRPRIEIESIQLAELAESTAAFAGLRPRGATLVGRDLRVRNLRFAIKG